MRRKFALEQRQEAAVGRDRVGAVRHELGGGVQEALQ
jgi:hypothetical protein